MTDTPRPLPDPTRCPTCNSLLPPGLTPAQCPACLMRLGFDEPMPTALSSGTDEPGSTRLSTEPPPVVAGARHPDRIGPYRLVEPLGEGGMGIVYLAEQAEPIRRTVALKVIKLGMDTHEVVARFGAERQALALLDHPYIASVFDAGTTPDGRPYFVMEHVAGVPITEYCDAGRLSQRARLELFIKVCEAVQHAHQKGIIHRDLKPSNVLVMTQDGRAVPKVIDFGIARATDQTLTERTQFTAHGQLVGTPEYMSPEQADPAIADIDTRTDIYSLGVLLYELLVGGVPFEPTRLRRAGYAELLRIIREEDPPTPSTRLTQAGVEAREVAMRRQSDVATLSRQLRGDLDWITLRALEKDRSRRYASASELAADLARFLGDEPVVARPPSLGYRVQKFVRRNRVAVIAGSVVLLAVVVGLVVSTVQYVRAERARSEADRQREIATDRAADANLNAAHMLVQNSNSAEARRRLLLIDSARRGWEWRHLFLRADQSVASFDVPEAGIAYTGSSLGGPGMPFVWSRDGRTLFWNAGEAFFSWDAATYKPILTRFGLKRLLAVSANGHAVRLEGDRVTIVDPTSQRTIADLGLQTSRASAAAFDRDGRAVAVGFQDGTIRVVGAEDGRITARTLIRGSAIQQVVLSDDGRRLAWRNGGGVGVWRVEDARAQRSISGEFRVVALNGAGTRLAAGAEEGVLIADVETGVERRLVGHRGWVIALAFSADGTRLLSGAQDPVLRIWDVNDGQLIDALAGSPIFPVYGAVGFTPAGDRALSADGIGEVRIWRTVPPVRSATIAWRGAPAPGRRPPLLPPVLALRPDGSMIATGDDGGSLRIWSVPEGRLLATLPLVERRKTVAWTPDGTRLMTESITGTTRLWTDAGVLVRELSEQAGAMAAWDASADSRLIAASAPGNSTVHVWDAHSGLLVVTLKAAGVGSVVRFSPDNRLLVASTVNDRVMRVWEVPSGRLRCELKSSSVGSLVEFGPDREVLTSAAGNSVAIWNLASGKQMAEVHLPESEKVQDLSFAGDAKLIVWTGDPIKYPSHGLLGFSEGTARVWDWRSNRLSSAIRGREGEVVSDIRASTDGRTALVTLTRKREVSQVLALWDVEPFNERCRIRTVSQPLNRLQARAMFTPDGRRVVTAWSHDEALSLWDVESCEPVLTLDSGPASGHQRQRAALPGGFVSYIPFFTADGTRLSALIMPADSPDILVRSWDSRLTRHPAAEPLVDALYERIGLSRDVAQQLATDKTLDADLRRDALALVSIRGDNPSRLDNLASSLSSGSVQDPDVLRRCRDLREGAVRLRPQDVDFAKRLDESQHRLTLALLTAGRTEEGNAELARLRQAATASPGDDKLAGFVREAEALAAKMRLK